MNVKKIIAAALGATVLVGSLAACADDPYNQQPVYTCPAYGIPGQPGYRPATPPRVVTPPRTSTKKSGTTKTPTRTNPVRPASPPRVSLRK